jgi:hypothetical protein
LNKEEQKMKATLPKIALFLLSILMLPALTSADEGEHVCQNKKWTGSYLQPLDFYGPGSFVFRWNFSRDGTLVASNTAAPEDAANSGTITPIQGSWECREDGKIVATYTYARYNGNWSVLDHVRMTALVTIEDENTLRRTALVARFYQPGENVTDPDAGARYVVPVTQGWELHRLRPTEQDLQDLL